MLYYPSLHCEPTICHQKGSLTDKGLLYIGVYNWSQS